MLSRDYRDIFAGSVLVLGGLLLTFYASYHYDIGTLRHMGPGMFPAALGVMQAVLGVAIAVPAFNRRGIRPQIRIWAPLFVLAGISSFALIIRPFGLIPAVLAVTIISSLADLSVRPLSLLALCATLCLVAWVSFSVALGLSTPVINWPF